MTIDEAIKWFEDELSGGKCSPDCVQCNANEMALSALREQKVTMQCLDRAIKEIMSDDERRLYQADDR